MKKSFFLGLMLVIVATQNSCSPVNLDQRAKVYEQEVTTKLGPVLDKINKEATFANRDRLRAIASKCLVDEACTAADIKKWVPLLPTKSYYDHVAEVKTAATAEFSKITNEITNGAKKKTLLLEELFKLQAVNFESLINNKVVTTVITFPQIARHLDNKKLFNPASVSEFKVRATDFICSSAYGLTDLKIRATFLSNPAVRDLLGSFKDLDNFNTAYADFRKKSDTIYRINDHQCTEFKLYFSENCIVDTFRPIHAQQEAEAQIVQAFLPKFQADLCKK